MKTSDSQKKAMHVWYLKNKDRVLEYQRQYRKTHQDKIKGRARKYVADNRSKILEQHAKYRATHRELYRTKTAKYRRDLWEEGFKFFGPCECCGESRREFLALDHRNGFGNEHRRQIHSRDNRAILAALRRMGWPERAHEDYRFLCHNCNSAFGWYGICPHQREKDETSGVISKTT
jgi:hypothetical protein